MKNKGRKIRNIKSYYFFFALCLIGNCSAQIKPALAHQEIYRYKWPNGNYDIVEFRYSNDSLKAGVYKGIYWDWEKNITYHFTSNFVVIPSSDKLSFEFNLDSFIVRKDSYATLSKSEIPSIFSGPMRYSVTRVGQNLEVNRWTVLHMGSNFDAMYFTKISQNK